MDPNALLDLLAADTERIAAAIATGAAWEIWLQVELILHLHHQNLQAARELAYAKNDRRHLDLLLRDAEGLCAIELKVESASNAGPQIVPALQEDAEKLAQYCPREPMQRWVLGVAYSSVAGAAMREFAAGRADCCWRCGGGLCFFVLVVS